MRAILQHLIVQILTKTKVNQMSQLYEIRAQIKNQPPKYLRQTSLPHLFMFLNGYKIAKRDLGITITSEEQEFYRDFHPWIQKK
jgi:hypothetical protein